MYYTYVLYSPQFNKIYVGFSNDVTNRIAAHNAISNSGWTSHYRPWEILYSEIAENKSEAMKREKQLKSSRGRNFIWNLVGSRKSSLPLP